MMLLPHDAATCAVRIKPAIVPPRAAGPNCAALARPQQDFQRTIDGIDAYQAYTQQFQFSFARPHE
jgi:hypothetical protein